MALTQMAWSYSLASTTGGGRYQWLRSDGRLGRPVIRAS